MKIWMKIGVLLLLAVFVMGCGHTKPVGENTGGGVIAGKSYKTVNEILTAGSNQKCSVEQTRPDGMVFKEDIYISGQDMRADVNIIDTNGGMQAHTIKSGDWFYTWSSLVSTGTKYKWTEIPNPEFEPKTGTDMKEEINFKCVAWSVDSSVFSVPTGVQFIDMTDSLKGATGGAEDQQAGDKTAMCDFCQNAPTEEEKNNCLEQLGC